MDFAKLVEWNPWWESGEVADELAGIPRPMYSDLVDSVGLREVTILTGVRRSGKSTLMYQMIGNLLKRGVSPKNILFVNLEDKKLAQDSLDDIYEAYRQNINLDKNAYIFLDEVHRKDGWESWIRKKYDLKTNDKFVISGSCSYLLKKEYSTLLTGRNLTFEVFPLGFEEFLLFKNFKVDLGNLKAGVLLDKTRRAILNFFSEYLNLGGFPEVLFKPGQFKMRILEQYFDDILYKDIVDRYDLNSQKAKELALLLMTNFTGLFSLRNVRSSLNLSYDTVKDYISYYKEAFLFFTVDQFSYSFKEQKSRPSKIYCIDNGLRNSVSFKFSKDEGKLAENLVFVELKRSGSDVFYWKNKGEVDFVVKNKDQSITAINVSYTDELPEREVKALLEFKAKFKSKVKELIVLTKNSEGKEQSVRLFPLWKWLTHLPWH